MNIVCPHCTTSYAVDPANFAAAGRRVRCVRCHEIWLAVPQEMATAEAGDMGSDYTPDRITDDWQTGETPHIDSPSISADRPDSDIADRSWSALAQQNDGAEAISSQKPGSRFKGFENPVGRLKSSKWTVAANLPTACLALSALVFVLLGWRADVVRMMPQTAAFYKMIGMGVNLRGLVFEDVKISTEMVNNKPVLLIEGAIIDVARKSVEIPRLRFIVRDANGADIYAWNAVLEQPVINPGEKAWFKTRLAAPPAEGREIAVRFFHKLDVAAGGT